ncbi:hypothetical protein SAMN05443270_3053 [Lacrimispora sphenoides]|uniref:hypothetical protein n=1 Tax=Lacrimispora sphenoides TaxID=29370 RepID=UPI0008BBFF7D|nr:hypothetical protein [Lacrimispora sphenoides]SEU08923.1 hypothetical protein SAMN05443270_3053 [Lacrimispora sphenoides]
MEYYNSLVDRMVREARRLLSNKGLSSENEVMTILKAAQIIIVTNEVFETSFFDEKDDIIDDISILYKERLNEAFV